MKGSLSAATANLENALTMYIDAISKDHEQNSDVQDTPKRFVKQLQECLSGYDDDPEQHAKVFDSDGYTDLVIVRDITFSSLCEHHMVPFYGTIDVAYLPNGKILGLSKFARLADAFGRRLQVQERITKQLADLLQAKLNPELLIVKISAKHMCMCARGVRRPNSVTDTCIIRGDTDNNAHYIKQFFLTTTRG